jgi:hypothetical protein
MKEKEFHYRGRQAAIVAKSGVLDLKFGWKPTPATTLAAVVPCQASRKAVLAGLLGGVPLAMLLHQ